MPSEKIAVDVTRVILVNDMDPISTQHMLLTQPEGKKLVAKINKIEVTNQAQCDVLNEHLTSLNKILKHIDKSRLEVTKPLRVATADINMQAKNISELFEICFNAGKKKVQAYRTEQQRLIDAENKRIADENAAKEAKAAKEEQRRKNISIAKGGDGSKVQVDAEPLEAAAAPLSQIDSTKVRKQWKLTCIMNVDDVPDKYIIKTVDKKAVREAIKNNVREIPGLKIEEVETQIY